MLLWSPLLETVFVDYILYLGKHFMSCASLGFFLGRANWKVYSCVNIVIKDCFLPRFVLFCFFLINIVNPVIKPCLLTMLTRSFSDAWSTFKFPDLPSETPGMPILIDAIVSGISSLPLTFQVPIQVLERKKAQLLTFSI